MPTDLEIAQAAQPKRIQEIAEKAGIPEGAISPYGQYIAKVDPMQLGVGSEMRAKLILVTAINPTPAGEGKTTVSVGLADGMTKIGKKAMLALREPSLGPVFGMKGGAAGGGRAQVLPMEQINLHFTGDLHAITAANNLLAAMVDNHIQQGNVLGIDPRQVTWRRCLDVNDRQLRAIVSGLGGKPNGNPREDGFDITAASEVMAVFCLAKDLQDLKARLSRLQVARTYSGKPVTAGDLHAAGAMTALLRDALQPNLVQTIDGTPCLMHGGPFANIAHGCNSVIATTTAMRLADYVVTEAGFGADLGAEKFMDIKCRMSGIFPDAVVLVATVRALKSHGGCPKADLSHENVEALRKGLPNLLAHIDHIRNVWKRPVVVALNRFVSDTEAEMALLRQACADAGAPVELCDGWAKGGDGVKELAARVCSSALTSVGDLSNVTSIGNSAFSGCSALASVGNLSNVTSIGDSAFAGCASWESIGNLQNVKSIGESAFGLYGYYDENDKYQIIYCTSLKSIGDMPKLETIGASAFSCCSSLASVGDLSSVTSIGEYAFDGCSLLVSVGDLSSVTSIGNSAFSGCSSLASIGNLPNVTSIGERRRPCRTGRSRDS